MEIPLQFGSLLAPGYHLHCSGVRWLCEPDQHCRAHQPIAYFNLSLESAGAPARGLLPFADERSLQVVCAPRIGGRVRFDPADAPGGFLSFHGINHWNPEGILGHLEIDTSSESQDSDPGRLRLLLLAGRRMTPLVDVHAGLLPGWNSRSRSWWSEEGETPLTLLCLGICDTTGVVLGEDGAFLEMFESEARATQFVSLPDHPLAPAAPVLLDQLGRSEAQFRTIAADLQSALAKPGMSPTADDWMFAGTLLASMEGNPIRETYDLLSPSGLSRCRPADAILLSVQAEPPVILRHKTLGYRVHVLRHHQAAAGPCIRHWLANAFEAVPRTISGIKADYEALIDAIKKATGAHVLILNGMSTSGDETISSYAPFDAPLSATLANIASKELNLMLHDLAASRGISIIDVDAIAAAIGAGEHLPDGIHQSKVMQQILREEILHVLEGLRPKS